MHHHQDHSSFTHDEHHHHHGHHTHGEHHHHHGHHRHTNMNQPSVLERKVMELYQSTADVPGLEVIADFYMWVVKKFKNLTRCWRMLDKNLNMKLTYLEFLTSLRT